jgi:hypothetical protein
MSLKVFVKPKKTLKTLSSGQKTPKNPLGWFFEKKTGFSQSCYQGRRRSWRVKVGESIGMLFTINKYQEAARATREAARALGLTRPFPVVDQILNSVADKTGFRSLPLNQVSRD